MESENSKDVVLLLKSQEDFICGQGVTEEEILSYEKELNLKFSKEYREYLLKLGCCSFGSTEFTGGSKEKYINIVEMTKDEWEYNEFVPKDLYLIENLCIDGILIWQNEKGEIFETHPNGYIKKIFDSLYDYVESIEY